MFCTGKKFTVTYKSKDDLQKAIDAAQDPMTRFFAEVNLCFAGREFELPKNGNFPGVKFTTVEELLKRTYGK
jgi:hypothetical protein